MREITMYINKCIFLTGIGKSIRYRSCVPLNSRRGEERTRSVNPIMRLYNKAHHYIIQIDCDGEFSPVLTPFESQLETPIHSCMPDEHVPEAERNNRVIQERVRIKYRRMPYKKFLEL